MVVDQGLAECLDRTACAGGDGKLAQGDLRIVALDRVGDELLFRLGKRCGGNAGNEGERETRKAQHFELKGVRWTENGPAKRFVPPTVGLLVVSCWLRSLKEAPPYFSAILIRPRSRFWPVLTSPR